MRYLLLTALLVGCAGKDDSSADRTAAVLELTGDSANGETLYAECAVCHGADGSGSAAYPSLIDEVPAKSDEEILDYVINGEEEMPSFADWTDQELADILAYLRDTFQ